MAVESPCFVAYESDGLAELSLGFLERMGCQTLSLSENKLLPFTLNERSGAIVVRTISKELIAPRGWSTRRAGRAKLIRFRGSFIKLLSRSDIFFEHLVPVWHQGQVRLLVGIRFDAGKRIKEDSKRFEQALRQISMLRFNQRQATSRNPARRK